MSAAQLIEITSKAGYSVGRNKPGTYRYGTTVNGQHVEREFVGGWAAFCKFMKALCK